MRYSRLAPGDSPASDAYNLMVAAHLNDERTALDIGKRVNDWESVAGYLAALAGIFGGFTEQVIPDDSFMERLAAYAERE